MATSRYFRDRRRWPSTGTGAIVVLVLLWLLTGGLHDRARRPPAFFSLIAATSPLLMRPVALYLSRERFTLYWSREGLFIGAPAAP